MRSIFGFLWQPVANITRGAHRMTLHTFPWAKALVWVQIMLGLATSFAYLSQKNYRLAAYYFLACLIVADVSL